MGKSKKKPNAAPKPAKKPPTPQVSRGQYDKLLHRFYEPLVLMHTLGSVRDEPSPTELFPTQNVSELPLKMVRRQCLADLAYMCDYDKGGDTVTAIGLENTPQGYVYWVAANTCPGRKIVPFLKNLLGRLQVISRDTNRPSKDTEDSLADWCLDFAKKKVKKYNSLLKPLLAKCMSYLESVKPENCGYPFQTKTPCHVQD